MRAVVADLRRLATQLPAGLAHLVGPFVVLYLLAEPFVDGSDLSVQEGFERGANLLELRRDAEIHRLLHGERRCRNATGAEVSAHLRLGRSARRLRSRRSFPPCR